MNRKIFNKNRFKQPILFEGLERDKISFTDIDFIQEIRNKLLIVGDVKVEGQKLPIGQRLLIERLCDKDWEVSYGVVVEHNVPSDQPVILKDTIVRDVYYNGKWEHSKQNFTFGQFEDYIKQKYNSGGDK